MAEKIELRCSMGDEPIDPLADEEGVDYMVIAGGKLILCECCVQTIIGAAKTSGMIE
jgi:hypothetical protein